LGLPMQIPSNSTCHYLLLPVPLRDALKILWRPGHLIHTQEWHHIRGEVAQVLAESAMIYTQAQGGAFKYTTLGFGKAMVRANYFMEVRLVEKLCNHSSLLSNTSVANVPHYAERAMWLGECMASPSCTCCP